MPTAQTLWAIRFLLRTGCSTSSAGLDAMTRRRGLAGNWKTIRRCWFSRAGRVGPRATAGRASSMSRAGLLMKLASAHEPLGDVGGLQFGAFGRRMGSEIARDRDEDMPPFVGIAPFAELPHAGIQHLVGMETCVLAQ